MVKLSKSGHIVNEIEVVQHIELFRTWGRSWASIDKALGFNYGRSRRVYKRICAYYGIEDRHHYRHCKTY